MTRHFLPLLFIILILHTATSLKIFTLLTPYLIPAQSTTQVDKQLVSEDLPIYRDLPPMKKETKDLSEAVEATKNLKFTRPPLDIDAFYASLRKAAEEVRNVVIGVGPPPFPNIQIRKSDLMDSVEKSGTAKGAVTSKSSNEAFQTNTKVPARNVQVKRSENSFVTNTGGESEALKKAASELAVSYQVPFTNVQVKYHVHQDPVLHHIVKRSENSFVTYTGGESETLKKAASEVAVSVQAPFTNVQVRKELNVQDQPGDALLTESPQPDSPGVGVGVVNVEAPFTSVQVHKGSGIQYPHPGFGSGVHVEAPFTSVKVQKGPGYGLGAQVGVNVDVPFTSVKVKKVAADIPPGPPIGPVDGGSYHEAGVHVDVPFVKVKVGGTPVAKGVHTVVDEDQLPPKPLVGVGGFLSLPPRKPGKPLDLDISIPGIFNLRLFRDQAGRGRLGIGVLPIFSSAAGHEHPSHSYPPHSYPPPPSA